MCERESIYTIVCCGFVLVFMMNLPCCQSPWDPAIPVRWRGWPQCHWLEKCIRQLQWSRLQIPRPSWPAISALTHYRTCSRAFSQTQVFVFIFYFSLRVSRSFFTHFSPIFFIIVNLQWGWFSIMKKKPFLFFLLFVLALFSFFSCSVFALFSIVMFLVWVFFLFVTLFYLLRSLFCWLRLLLELDFVY